MKKDFWIFTRIFNIIFFVINAFFLELINISFLDARCHCLKFNDVFRFLFRWTIGLKMVLHIILTSSPGVVN